MQKLNVVIIAFIWGLFVIVRCDNSVEIPHRGDIVITNSKNFTLPPLEYDSFSGPAVDRNFLYPGPVVQTQNDITLPPMYFPPPVPRSHPKSRKSSEFAPAPFECSDPTLGLCGQVAWTDYSLALSGLSGKYELCNKYTPSSSCVSKALSSCALNTDTITRSMLIAIARVLVSWCYDGGYTIAALEQHDSCYAAAILHAMTFDKCLMSTHPKLGLAKSFMASSKSEQGLSVPGLLNAAMGNFGTETLRCMYNSIKLTCGDDAAELALQPALDEFDMRQPTARPEDLNPAFFGRNETGENGTFTFEQNDHPFFDQDLTANSAIERLVFDFDLISVMSVFACCIHLLMTVFN